MAAIIDAAREAAWQPSANLSSAARYNDRREAYDRLRQLTRREGWQRPFFAVGRPLLLALGFAIWRAAKVDASNRRGEPYFRRRQVMAQLRACLVEFDRAG